MTRNLKGDSGEGNENKGKGEENLLLALRERRILGLDWSVGECSAERNFEVTESEK